MIAKDDPPVEFAIFGQFLALIANVIVGAVILSRSIKRTADVLNAREQPKILVVGETHQADYALSLVQMLRVLPAVALLAGQQPLGVELVRVVHEHIDGIGLREMHDETDFRTADLLVREVKQIIEHDIVAHTLNCRLRAITELRSGSADFGLEPYRAPVSKQASPKSVETNVTLRSAVRDSEIIFSEIRSHILGCGSFPWQKGGAMKSIQVANAFILRHGSDIDITNLVLNKLVYFAQVESLRATGKPLFEDKIEAWPYGPVERNVYFTFQKYGRNRILKSEGETAKDEQALSVVDGTAKKYGFLTAFDLVGFSHRKNSAWKNVYREGENVEITNDAILASDDGLTFPKNTLASSLDEVNAKWQNTFRILRNA